MASVKLENISKVYDGDVKAVNNVSINIEDKEFVVLVGPSGCGKSTTLRMIAGLEEITSGTLTIDGKEMNDVAPKDRDIAMVFQNYALYPHMSVYDNMAFGLKIRKVPKDEIDKRVKEAASMLDIESLLDRKPKALSGGQRQRVAVGRAIVRNPKVFLFDEPLSNLDAKLRVQMRAEISRLHDRLQATMIYVTHDQVEALTMADKIVVMKDGVIQQIGKPMELYNEPDNKFVAGFIGSPPMNFMEMRVESKDDGLTLSSSSFYLNVIKEDEALLKPYIDKEIVFGIRPEDLFYSHTRKDGETINGKVSVVEPLGSETQVYVSSDNTSIVGKIDPSIIPSVGEDVALTPKMEKARYFDKETELRIR